MVLAHFCCLLWKSILEALRNFCVIPLLPQAFSFIVVIATYLKVLQMLQ